MTKKSPISTGSDWTFELLETYNLEISKIAEEYGLDTYPNQIEVISSEQMMDAYASVGMPIGYNHWSYGKQNHYFSFFPQVDHFQLWSSAVFFNAFTSFGKHEPPYPAPG